MITRLAIRHDCGCLIKRFMRGMPIIRDTDGHKEKSPEDPFACGTVSRKTDISGEYVMKEEDGEKTGVEFWNQMIREKNRMDNEENLNTIPVGSVRRDSDNQPRYHGQFSPNNPKFALDDRTYDSVIASRRKASENSAPVDSENSSMQVDAVQKEERPPDDVLNVDDFFPNRSSLNTSQRPKIGQFSFKYTDEWFNSEIISRSKTAHYDDLKLPFEGEASVYGLKKNGEPDISVIEGLQFAQSSPLRSLEELNDEIEAIREETAANQTDPDHEKNDEKEVSSEDSAEKSASSSEGLTDEDKKSMTAYDYVMKLRKGEVKPESEKLQQAFDTAKINALDSQGFNSYRGYAPDLTQYRRSELLWNLKKSILFCDSDILAINKPHGLIVQGKERKDDSHAPVLTDLLEEFAELLLRERIISEPKKLRPVHRLDKETTGVLLLAMSSEKAAFLQKCFEQHLISKTYHAITKCVPDPYRGVIDIPIEEGHVDGKDRMVLRPELREEYQRIAHPRKHAKKAVTEFKVIAAKSNAALVELKPVTGVKHQVRVHMGFGMRCPILGDHKYTYLERIAPQKLPTDMLTSLNVRPSKVRNIPLHLFCRMVTIPGAGADGRTIFVKAHAPPFFAKTMKRLNLFQYE